MPKITPISSKVEIILPVLKACSTTKQGLLMAEIAVTGPQGPPDVIAELSNTRPIQAIVPLMKPMTIRSLLNSCGDQYGMPDQKGRAKKMKMMELKTKSALKVARSELKPILSLVMCLICILFYTIINGTKQAKSIGQIGEMAV
jgi:hypothetical protein